MGKMSLQGDHIPFFFFYLSQGDHITYLNVYKGFLDSGKSPQWCHENFVNYQATVRFNLVGDFIISLADAFPIILSIEVSFVLPPTAYGLYDYAEEGS